MMVDLGSINYLAVLVGAIINVVIGFLWYGPLFGKRWMAMIGKTEEEIQAESNSMIYVVTIIAALLAAFVLAVIVNALGAASALDGAIAGAVVWIGIGATATLVKSNFDNPNTGVWALFAIYMLIVYVINGILFAVWV